MPPALTPRPGFLANALLGLLIGWALLTGATGEEAVTGGVLAGVAALILAVAKGLQLVRAPGNGGGRELEDGRWQGKVLQILEQQTAILRELVEEQRTGNKLLQEHDRHATDLAAGIRNQIGRPA